MEVNTQRRGQGLREKIPDIKKTLEMVRFLKLRKEVYIPTTIPLTVPSPAREKEKPFYMELCPCKKRVLGNING